MAKNRSHCLCKKIRIREFQEVGSSVAWCFSEGIFGEQVDQVVSDFINGVIEPNKLTFSGSDCLTWGGLIYLQEVGKYTEERQVIVRKWLGEHKLEEMCTNELFDTWQNQIARGRQMPARFVLRERYDTQNAVGGSPNVHDDGRTCRLPT